MSVARWVAGDIREREGAERDRRGGARAPRAARPPAQQRRRPVLRARRGDHDQGLARRPAAERRRHAGDVRGGPRARDAAGRRGHDRQRDRLAAPRDAGDGPHGRGAGRGRGAHPRARRRLARRTASRSSRSRSGASPPSRCASTRPSCGARAAASVPLQRLGEVEEYGWLVALLASPLGRALSGSVVTLDGALDNWTGPWPPADLTRDGEVPTEERRPRSASSRPPGYHRPPHSRARC